MTITTTRSREHNVASGLHELADLFYAGSIPEPMNPEQGWRLTVLAPHSLAVHDFADRMGMTARQYRADTGDLHTTADLILGDGAVELILTHIAPTEAV